MREYPIFPFFASIVINEFAKRKTRAEKKKWSRECLSLEMRRGRRDSDKKQSFVAEENASNSMYSVFI